MEHVSSTVSTVNISGANPVVVTEPLLLTATPAYLLLRWNLGFTSCRAGGIAGFVVTLWRSATGDKVLESRLACSLEGEGAYGYRRVPDPERRIDGTELGEIAVQPFDRQGMNIGTALRFPFDAPGRGREVKITVDCMGSDYCTGQIDSL